MKFSQLALWPLKFYINQETLFFSFKCLFLRERERERERKRERASERAVRGGAERERERERRNLVQAPGSELSAQSPMWGLNPRTMRS